jgi:hypothetical protein
MQTFVHRNGPNRPHIPSSYVSFQRAESQQQPVAPNLERNKLPGPSIFPTAKFVSAAGEGLDRDPGGGAQAKKAET